MEPFVFDRTDNEKCEDFKSRVVATKLCPGNIHGQEREIFCADALYNFLSNVEFLNKDDAKYALRYLFGRAFECTLVKDNDGKPSGSHAVTLKCQNTYTNDDNSYTCSCNFRIAYAPSEKHENRLILAKKFINSTCLRHFFVLQNSLLSPCSASFKPTLEDFLLSPDSDELVKGLNHHGKTIVMSLKDKGKEYAKRGIHISQSNLKKASSSKNKAFASSELGKLNLLEPMLELLQTSTQLKFIVEKNVETNILERLIVVVPGTEEYCNSKFNTKLYGIDTAHMRDLPMMNDLPAEVSATLNNAEDAQELVFIGHKLAVLSTRTPSNNLKILGFAVVYTESA
jgi:hypothetical protein